MALASTKSAKANGARHVLYTMVDAKPEKLNDVRDKLRSKLKGAHIRRVVNEEQNRGSDHALMVVVEPDADILEKMRETLFTIDRISGVVRSHTRIGTLVYSAGAIPLEQPVGLMFIKPDAADEEEDELIRKELSSLPGIVQVAKLAGRHSTGVLYTFDSKDISSLFDVLGRVEHVLGSGVGEEVGEELTSPSRTPRVRAAAAVRRRRNYDYVNGI